ncbi:MAG: hypothetical protein WCQ86_05235, partial [Bacteroidaceae bacterium]
MSKLLFIKETIYKDEVDMIMKGDSVESIIEEMDQKTKERKEKEERKRQKKEGPNWLEKTFNKISNEIFSDDDMQ